MSIVEIVPDEQVTTKQTEPPSMPEQLRPELGMPDSPVAPEESRHEGSSPYD